MFMCTVDGIAPSIFKEKGAVVDEILSEEGVFRGY